MTTPERGRDGLREAVEALAEVIIGHQRIPMYGHIPGLQRCAGGCSDLLAESDGPNSPRHALHVAEQILASDWLAVNALPDPLAELRDAREALESCREQRADLVELVEVEKDARKKAEARVEEVVQLNTEKALHVRHLLAELRDTREEAGDVGSNCSCDGTCGCFEAHGPRREPYVSPQARAESAEAERDEARAERDALRERVEALAVEWLDAGVTENGNYPETAVEAEDMCARILRAALADPEAS